MAIVYMRGWESGLAEGVTGGALESGTVHTGSYAYNVPQISTVTLLLPATYSDLWVSAWVNLTGFTSARGLIGLYSGANLAGGLGVNTDARLYLFDRNGATLITDTDVTLAAATWYHIQLHLPIGAAADIEAKLSGAVALQNNGTDTRPGGVGATVDRILSNTGGSGVSTILDDVVVSNSAYPGDVRIVTLTPDGAGNAQQFTPSTGVDHDALVDEIPPGTSGSDDYVYSSTTGHREQFTMSALPAISGNYTIRAVRVKAVASESAATGMSIDTGVRTAATNYDDSLTHLLQTSQTLHEGTIRETNPNTTATWTDAEVNGVEAGVKVL
jgi:hypothetical protein